MVSIKFVVLAVFVASVSAGHHGHGDESGPAVYEFEYGVHDPHTHDVKSQHEHRDGHNLKGSYTLNEPDGTKRVVDYVSDHKGGFQAIVHRIGTAKHPAHYGKHGHGHGGVGGTSYVGVTHYGYQGHGHGH